MATTSFAPPILESGDRLTRAEFHRRYGDRPDILKAELVEGVVYVGQPTRDDVHGEPQGLMVTWLGVFRAGTTGVRMSVEPTVYLDADNEVRPDAILRWESSGRTTRRPDGYIEGAPELIVEIAASSASYDLHDKLNAYRRNGVAEYIVWRTADGEIMWFRLEEGAYVVVQPNADGIIESAVFPGLRLNVPAMLAGDLAAVLAVVGRA
jgi:Uma2 family endonuclease